MSVDTSIYNLLQAPQVEGPLHANSKDAQFKGAQMQNKLAELALGQKEREISGDNALASLLASGKSGADVATGLAQQGYGAKSLDYTKQQSALDKSKREADKERLAGELQKFDVADRIMAGVNDQTTWLRAKQQTAQVFGPEAAAQMPDVYDPKLVEEKRKQAQPVKERLAQEWKAKEYDLDVSKFDETKRHNRQQEGIAGGNLAVARGNLGLRQQEIGQRDRELTAKNGPKANAEGVKKVAEARDVLMLLDEADKLLPNATGGYVGTSADFLAGSLGWTTGGAAATAQLKALQGALVSKMPKMSGPQSDKDVQLYREMAGQIGDPTVPVAQRQAASGMIRRLNEKYAGMPEGSSKGGGKNDIHSQADAILRGK